MARELVGPTDRLAVGVGCGAAGMALAIARMMTCGRVVAVGAHPAILDAARNHFHAELSDPRVRVEALRADIPTRTDTLRESLGAPADLVWAAAAIHHVGDQQAAITSLAGLLAPGGRLALAEGGLLDALLSAFTSSCLLLERGRLTLRDEATSALGAGNTRHALDTARHLAANAAAWSSSPTNSTRSSARTRSWPSTRGSPVRQGARPGLRRVPRARAST